MVSLYPHQKKAQRRMSFMESRFNGGFLCDSMGMGKTVTMSYFITNNRIDKLPDIIVCPLAVLDTWEKWLKKLYTKPERVIIYHGPKRKKILDGVGMKPHFIITTYHTMNTNELKCFKWGRMILDESHTIRNLYSTNASKRAKGTIQYGKKALKRWCVTGTPFINRIDDISAQCTFIGTYPYNSIDWWKNANPRKKLCWYQRHVIQRSKENLVKAPNYHNIFVDHTENEKKRTKKLCSNAIMLIQTYQRRIAEGQSVEDIRAVILKLMMKLRIVSNSYLCRET